MCSNTNYCENHWGHNVVPLENAFAQLKAEYTHNMEILDRMEDIIWSKVEINNGHLTKLYMDKENAYDQINDFVGEIKRLLNQAEKWMK